jgi:SAM-dependent methyltransferase
VKLDVFSAIGEGEVSAADTAAAVGASADGVERLLNALTAMGLLDHRDGRYGCPPSVRALLDRSSPGYLGHIILHHHHLMSSWAHLEEAVASGRPVGDSPRPVSREEWRESFLLGMFNMAMGLAPLVAAALDLSASRSLLDLGGGPGTYAIHFCLRNPGLTATVYDLPTTRPFAERTIARFGLADRIRFAPGDYLEDPVPGRYDTAWLSHILHGEGPEDCLAILRKAVGALTPGGKVMIHEFILDDTKDGPLFPALFSLNMLQGTERGRSYSGRELTEMMSAAGARDIRRIALRTPNDSGILIGVA